MRRMYVFLTVHHADDGGATMVEYSIMVALIASVSILIVTSLGGNVFNMFDNARNVTAPIGN